MILDVPAEARKEARTTFRGHVNDHHGQRPATTTRSGELRIDHYATPRVLRNPALLPDE